MKTVEVFWLILLFPSVEISRFIFFNKSYLYAQSFCAISFLHLIYCYFFLVGFSLILTQQTLALLSKMYRESKNYRKKNREYVNYRKKIKEYEKYRKRWIYKFILTYKIVSVYSFYCFLFCLQSILLNYWNDIRRGEGG